MDNLSDKNVLDLIRSGRAETQAELCQITGMRSSTMSCILKRLRDGGLVQSAGTRVVGRGKPATILRFAPPGQMLAIDVDGTQAEIAVMNFTGTVIEEATVEFGTIPKPEILLSRLERTARQLVERAGVLWRDLRALGVSVNGYVSPDGILEFSTVLPWSKVPISRLAREIFGLGVYCTDGRDRAVAEYRQGAGQGSEVMLYFNVADGISARPVVHGQLLRGGHWRSGEIGHVVVIPNGPPCGCGQRGCLEAVVSGPGIVRRILADAKDDGALAQRTEVSELLRHARSGRAAKTIAELIRLGEEEQLLYAQRLIDELITLTGKALGTAAACFDPDSIVVEGYVFRDRPVLLRRLWQAANACFKPRGIELVKLTPAMLGPRGKFLSLVTFVGDNLALAGKLTG